MFRYMFRGCYGIKIQLSGIDLECDIDLDLKVIYNCCQNVFMYVQGLLWDEKDGFLAMTLNVTLTLTSRLFIIEHQNVSVHLQAL